MLPFYFHEILCLLPPSKHVRISSLCVMVKEELRKRNNLNLNSKLWKPEDYRDFFRSVHLHLGRPPSPVTVIVRTGKRREEREETKSSAV